MQKEILMNYFKERSYECESMDDFENKVARAAELGAAQVFIEDIPKDHTYLECCPGDPYPNWGMLLTNLFKIIVPNKLREFLPVEYAQRNLELLKERGKILEKYGLKAALVLVEPFYLPESVYQAHPSWRGPRCDHPRRSKYMYYCPCIDNEEVREMYTEAMEKLCRHINIGYIRLYTNDSGGGLCWSSGLYNGANGPAACRDIGLPERILGLFDAFEKGASKAGRNIMLEITSNIGFKENEHTMDAMWPLLKDNQIVNGKNNKGQQTVSHIVPELYETVRPFYGLPLMADFANQLELAYFSDSSIVDVQILEGYSQEYCNYLELFLKNPVSGFAGKIALMSSLAESICGAGKAERLVNAWFHADEAIHRLKALYMDCIVMMGHLHQRWINRPLVPFPHELNADEKDYYRKFIFQATTETQADDLMNFQGMDFIRGFTATRIARHSVTKAVSLLCTATEEMKSLEHGGMDIVVKRMSAFTCMMKTFMHVAMYQEVLDRTDYGSVPQFVTRWPYSADERLLSLDRICRDEIDNTYELISILGNHANAFLPVAQRPEDEDATVLGPDITAQMHKKIQTMFTHMRDVDRLYESNNK
jgi:hypothetical protein